MYVLQAICEIRPFPNGLGRLKMAWTICIWSDFSGHLQILSGATQPLTTGARYHQLDVAGRVMRLTSVWRTVLHTWLRVSTGGLSRWLRRVYVEILNGLK